MRSLWYILAAVLAAMLVGSGAGLDQSEKASIYLGMNYCQEPVKLGGTAHSLPGQSARLCSHVPAIIDFIKNDWQPPQTDFDYYPAWVYQYLIL